MKKILKIILIILIALIIISFIGFSFLNLGMSEIKKLEIKNIDLIKSKDGTYAGSYHKGRWTYDVEVIIKDSKISEIKNLQTNKIDALKTVNSSIIKNVIYKQSVEIDAVSGATINSKALLKAIENALNKSII